MAEADFEGQCVHTMVCCVCGLVDVIKKVKRAGMEVVRGKEVVVVRRQLVRLILNPEHNKVTC